MLIEQGCFDMIRARLRNNTVQPAVAFVPVCNILRRDTPGGKQRASFGAIHDVRNVTLLPRDPSGQGHKPLHEVAACAIKHRRSRVAVATRVHAGYEWNEQGSGKPGSAE